jgi:ribosomal protein S18 acetylase RimI-like enzyme
MTLGFVHACEQNHRNLSTVGGGNVAQLASGKVVTSAVDPFWLYNYAFGVRRALDLDELAGAFRAAGRDYLHVMASPSSRPGLAGELERLGFHREWEDLVWRAAGTGAGAPGLLRMGPGELDGYLATVRSAWGAEQVISERALALRLADGRSSAYRSADGTGVFALFASGPTTQLIHLAVAGGAQRRGVGRRMLELAPGLVAAGRPLWLSSDADGPAVRAAAAAGWTAAHGDGHWLLGLDDAATDRPGDAGARATKGSD